MPSRFNLPHLDIAAFVLPQDYVGESGFNNSAVRSRDEHGRRIQNELKVALTAAQQTRPAEPRLEHPTGNFVEVERRRGTHSDALDMKSNGIRSGAAKADHKNVRTIALYVPDHARPILDQILNDYLTGPL